MQGNFFIRKLVQMFLRTAENTYISARSDGLLINTHVAIRCFVIP